MRRALFFVMVLCMLLGMMGCDGSVGNPDAQTEPTYEYTVKDLPDRPFYVFQESMTFQEREKYRRKADGLDRNHIFGDTQIQKEAEAARGDLDLRKVGDVLEYANRLIPIIEGSGYCEVPEGGLLPLLLYYYEDGVWMIHYDKMWSQPDNYDEILEQDRRFMGGKYDGGMYVNISTSDGHIISLEGSYNELIEGKEALKPGKEQPIPEITWRMAKAIEFGDLTLQQHFNGWTGERGEMYAKAPTDYSESFEDEALRQAALAACADLRLDTAEGMSEYAWRLGDLLLKTEYGMCTEGYQILFLDRYTDGMWMVRYEFPDSSAESKEKLFSELYVSEEDGHIICMFDGWGQLVTPAQP